MDNNSETVNKSCPKSHPLKKSGFEETLVGTQEWPPKKVVISDKREEYNLWVKLHTESPFKEAQKPGPLTQQ